MGRASSFGAESNAFPDTNDNPDTGANPFPDANATGTQETAEALMALESQALLTVNVELSKLDAAMARFVNVLGISLPRVVKTTARLLNADLMKLTPPKSQAQGRKAVARDINRAIMGIDPDEIHNIRLREMVLRNDFEGVRAFLRNIQTGLFANFQLVRFAPSYHTSARDARGRVRTNKLIMTADIKEHRQYVRMVQGRVGSTKAWWAPSAQRLGNYVPSWIARHQVPGTAVVDNLSDKENPRFKMINAGKGIGNVPASAVASAIRRRHVAMNNNVERVLAGGAFVFK